MTESATWRKICVACLATLLLVFAIILLRSGSNQNLDAESQTLNALDQSSPYRGASSRQASGDRSPVLDALSRDGLTEVERIERRFGTIRKNGIWLPVTNDFGRLQEGIEEGEQGDDDAETPLYITTGTLPFGRVGEEYQVTMEAVGGKQPYRWSVDSGDLPQPLLLDPLTGQIVGTAEEPQSGRFRIRVTDANDQSDIAEYELAIEPNERLELVTDALPSARVGESYGAILQAAGGMPPYRWSLEGEFGLIGQFEIDPHNGVLSGTVLPDLESTGVGLRVVVQDQQVAVEKDLILPISAAYALEENPQAESDPSGENSPEVVAAEGQNEGEVSMDDAEPEAEISTRTQNPASNPGFVPDGSGGADDSQKTGRLTAATSLRRIGLKWTLPADLEETAVRLVRSETGFPATADSGFVVFEGIADSVVDEGLSPGVFYYSLFAAGIPESVNAVEVTLPPAVNVDPFGTAVASRMLLHPAAYQAGRLPDIVTGPPHGAGLSRGSSDVVSLGAATNDDAGASAPYGGSLTIELGGYGAWDGPGADFTVFENVFYVKGASGNLDPNSRFMEPAIVAVSQDGVNFRQFPFDFSPRYDAETGELNLRHPYAYNRGFAGINPVLSNGSFPDPTDPRVSGGDSFDIGELGLEWIRFVRIQSIGDRWLVDSSGDVVPHNREAGAAMRAFNGSGFDLDAVAAIWHQKVESR